LTQSIVAIAPPGLPRVDAVTMDQRVATFALAVGGLTLLVFGVAPAWMLARTPAMDVLAEGRQHGGSPRHRGQRVLVAAQLALALVLLVGATLFGETILRLTATPLGFEPSNLAVVSTSFTGPRRDLAAQREAQRAAQRDPTVNFRAIQEELMRVAAVERTERVTARLRALPGVTAVAGTWRGVPFFSAPTSGMVHVDKRPDAEVHDAQSQLVTDTYFKTMGMSLRAGRNFDASDGSRTPQVAVVSEEFERRVLGGHALGRRFTRPPATTVVTVIGVVRNVKREESFTREDRPTYYTLDRQVANEIGQLIIRTASDPARLMPDIRQAIAEVTPQIVVTSTTTMDELLGRLRANERFRATLSACFGGAALLLAAVGLYGLAARRVADRGREFGIRVALGAAPASIRALVVKDVLLIVGAGLLVGLPAAFATARATRSWLFGVSPTSPHIFLLASVGLTAVALLAALLPARRAGRLDPVRALKD
jgi:predicted permease